MDRSNQQIKRRAETTLTRPEKTKKHKTKSTPREKPKRTRSADSIESERTEKRQKTSRKRKPERFPPSNSRKKQNMETTPLIQKAEIETQTTEIIKQTDELEKEPKEKNEESVADKTQAEIKIEKIEKIEEKKEKTEENVVKEKIDTTETTKTRKIEKSESGSGSGSESEDEEEKKPNTTEEDKGLTEAQKIAKEMQLIQETLSTPPAFGRGLKADRRTILLKALKCNDIFLQSQAVEQLNEALALSTEENMAGFQSDKFVSALGELLNIHPQENLELTLMVCRTLINLLEALPASAKSFLRCGVIPQLQTKIVQSIECFEIELAECAIPILTKISETQPVDILRSGVLETVCNIFHFLPSSQQKVIDLTVNVCSQLPEDCFPTIKTQFPFLVDLLSYSDQKISAGAVHCFWKLTRSFFNDKEKLEEIHSCGLIPKLIILISDSNLKSNTYGHLLRTMALLCRGSPTVLKTVLGKNGIMTSLAEILTKESDRSTSSSAQQLVDIFSLANELLPSLPPEIADFLSVSPSSSAVSSLLTSYGNRLGRNHPSFLQTPTIPPETTQDVDPRIKMFEEEPHLIKLVGECLG